MVMTTTMKMPSRRPLLLAIAALLSGVWSNDASAQIDWGSGARREDSKTCRQFGAGRGEEYTRCMLQQQRRRDNAPLYAAEQQRNNAEAARNNVETVRRIRCNREAKRARERGEWAKPC
jgi:hypothetical protein